MPSVSNTSQVSGPVEIDVLALIGDHAVIRDHNEIDRQVKLVEPLLQNSDHLVKMVNRVPRLGASGP